ncbi:MAG: histidine ammonia-lyase [Gemmatimonadota bacterium]
MTLVTGRNLSLEDLVAVARRDAPVAPLDDAVRAAMEGSRAWVAEAVSSGERPIYGVNTGFGPLADRGVAADDAGRLSRNLVLNCCAGVGPPLPDDVVRAMMLIRVATLSHGRSGVRPELAETYIRMLNEGVVPQVPAKGSLGASGDLAPLAHIAAVMCREPGAGEDGGFSGTARYGGEVLSGAEAMRRAGIPRLEREAKDGLALTNGTTFMIASGALAAHDARNLGRVSLLSAALSMEALLALTEPLHPALNAAGSLPGQVAAAAALRTLLDGSRLVDEEPGRVQDAYSLRCTPQIVGPIRDMIEFVASRFEASLSGISDNPLVFAGLDGESSRAISGGNFHGQGPALWLDTLGIAVAELGSVSERRTFRLLTPELSAGLPSMLVANSGLDSGLMVSQYTAAALVSDNKTLAHPDSVDSIPSSANQEDHVSMGANAARHAAEILRNVELVLAIELLAAAQAVDLRPDGPARLGQGTRVVHREVRARVPFLEHDRELTSAIETLADLVASGGLVETVMAEIGEEWA